MYSVCVRDHFMIAHSFTGAVFGPAQRLHGATYVVDVEFRRHGLDADGIVVDIGRAAVALRAVLAAMNYRNLDEVAAFKGRNTSTEFLARAVFNASVDQIRKDHAHLYTGRAVEDLLLPAFTPSPEEEAASEE